MGKRVVVITGSSRGIGRSIAEYLSKNDFIVIGLSRHNVESDLFETIPSDITKKEEVEKSINYILEKYNKIDVLINNAGKGMVGPIENANDSDIIDLFKLNLISANYLMTAVLPSMRKLNKGKIINISSIGSEMGLPFRGYYSASKSALDKITESIRYELINTNIQVTSLHLGDIQTNIADYRINGKVDDFYLKSFNKVFKGINEHVSQGSSTNDVAKYILKLINKSRLKSHYYFGKFGQKISITLKKLLPQRIFENIIAKYSNI